MPRPIRILFLLEDLCYGGTQKQNLALATMLDRQQFDPMILTLTGPTDLDDFAGNVRVRHLGASRKVAPFFFALLGKVLRDINPDILVPCTALPNIWGRIWGKILGVPVVVGTCRGGGAPSRQHERFLWRMADHIVCNSLASVESMRNLGVPGEHLSYIANGVDTDAFAPIKKREKGAPLILCVARLAKDKDHLTLLKAFGLAWAKNKALKLRIVGEGPEEDALKDFVVNSMDAACAANIEFAGASNDTASHYHVADIFALSSVREGQPNVILEAMSCGLPVCASSVGGIPALVQNDTTGLLSPPGDAGELSANFLRLAANPELAERMGAAGREVVENNYSFAAMVNAHEKLFNTLFDRRTL